MSKLKYHKKPHLVPCSVKKNPYQVSFESPRGAIFEIDEEVRVMAKPIQRSATSPRFTYGFAKVTKIDGNNIQIKLKNREVISEYNKYSVEIPPKSFKKKKMISDFFSTS